MVAKPPPYIDRITQKIATNAADAAGPARPRAQRRQRRPGRGDGAVAEGVEGTPDAYYITLPGERSKSLQGGVYYDVGDPDLFNLDPATGKQIPETAGGEFFFTLHFNLHSPTWGMYIVGLAGMFMLIAIFTGIVIHKRIFKDFFTFRPKNGGQRAWLDGHNLTGVLGLPFHL
ncbi:hypothetical protein CATMIT_01987, partial [Catenibacterium mitsuokai DSM 15897]